MSALAVKLRRELWHSVGTLASVVAIIAIGAASYIGIGSAARIVGQSQATYYSNYRLADFWVEVKKAPLTVVERLAALPEVTRLETRIAYDVILDVPDEPQPLAGRLISVPPERLDTMLNGLHLIRGTRFSPNRDDEVILNEAFAKAHGLQPGDTLTLLLNRKRERFRIIGTAISPEYVYMIRGEGDFIPDPRRFGTLYVKERFARDVLDFKDAFNQLVGTVSAAESGDVDRLLERLERELEPYGVLATTPRERQASNRFLSDEIKQLRSFAAVAPMIFMGVAALVLNVVMSRLIERQRTTIGTLKALGYSGRTILFHYLRFAVVIGLAGGVGGIGLGMLAARGMIAIYQDFFQFPDFDHRLYPDLMLTGIGISMFFAVGGALKGAWAALRLHPAEAMRPKPPERGGAIILERWPWLWRRLGFRSHMALRGLFRHPVRTGSAMLSTALATGIMFLSLTLISAVFFMLDFQFTQVLQSDVDIGYRDALSRRAHLEARDLPGVIFAEPIFAMTCDLRNGPHRRRNAIIGLDESHRLTRPLRKDLTPIDIPVHGLALAKKLAEILDVRRGDLVELTPVRGRRQTVHAPVVEIAESYLGLDCYADRRYLARLLGEGDAVSSIQMRLAPEQAETLFRRVKELPNAQALTYQIDVRETVNRTIIRTIATVHAILIFFAGVIAFGAILNNALVDLADRLREVSTLRVLGYSPAEVAAIFFRQSMLVFVCGLALGFPLSRVMLRGVMANTPTELVRIPEVMHPLVPWAVALVALVFVLAAQAIVYWRIRKLDWLEGVKVRE